MAGTQKKLYVIGGTMGVGKTETCRALNGRLPASVFLDGDWCWAMHPFVVTEETRALVMENITALLNNFLRCPAFDNVVFCWVLHEQAIWDELLGRLQTGGWRVVKAALVCSEAALGGRVEGDIARGVREPGDLPRTLARLPLYRKLDVPLLDTTHLTPGEAAAELEKW